MRLWKRRPPRPVVLMYHRIADVRSDPWGLAVEPRHFEAQMAYISERRTPLAMDELVRRLGTNTLPADAVAVTFDDGYRDNLLNAKPVLDRRGIPATVFIATGWIDRNAGFWWDELTAMILESEEPVRHAVVCGGTPIALVWGRRERGDTGNWRVSHGARTERQRAYVTVWSALQRAPAEERRRVLSELRARFETAFDPSALPMSRREVHDLVSLGEVRVGAHSVEHAALTSLAPAERRREITESAAACRDLSGHAVPGFAYPYGDMNAEACEDVRRAGFTWACSTVGQYLDEEPVDAYAIPRIAVPNASLRKLRRDQLL